MTMTQDPATGTELKDGRVVGIAGPVVDVEFPRGSLPKLNTALEFTVQVEGQSIVVLAEVAQQLGDSRVRAICMKPTDGHELCSLSVSVLLVLQGACWFIRG